MKREILGDVSDEEEEESGSEEESKTKKKLKSNASFESLTRQALILVIWYFKPCSRICKNNHGAVRRAISHLLNLKLCMLKSQTDPVKTTRD